MEKILQIGFRAVIVVAAWVLMQPAVAWAQTFPSKTIRFVVPYGTGGLPDVMGRLVAQKMSGSIGQQVIIENKPGASGIIAAEFVAKSDPDGHTLFIGDIAHYALNPALQPKLPYEPLRDFAPVTLAVTGPLVLVVNPSLGVHTVSELVALAKTHPGMNYGSPGNASVHQLAMEQFALMAGVKFVHIPYKGVAQAVPALLAGDTKLMFVSPTSVASNAKAGKLTMIAVASARRSPIVPDLPTVAESGFAGFEAVTNVGFLAPAATPRAVITRLNAELVRALKSPEIASKMPGLGADVVAGTPEEFTELIRADQAKYAKAVKEAGVKLD
jgi:tripartite-type tricarboxylate transporter receptor subunit TctC